MTRESRSSFLFFWHASRAFINARKRARIAAGPGVKTRERETERKSFVLFSCDSQQRVELFASETARQVARLATLKVAPIQIGERKAPGTGCAPGKKKSQRTKRERHKKGERAQSGDTSSHTVLDCNGNLVFPFILLAFLSFLARSLECRVGNTIQKRRTDTYTTARCPSRGMKHSDGPGRYTAAHIVSLSLVFFFYLRSAGSLRCKENPLALSEPVRSSLGLSFD